MAALTTIALLAASAAGTYSKFTSARREADIDQQQGNAQAGLLETNASLADQQAKDALARGQEGAMSVDRQGRALTGDQRAAYAAQGIDVDAGSAADVVGGDRAMSNLDALTIKNNAARAAWGFQTQASGYRAQADWARAAGANAATAARQRGTDTLLGGAGDLLNIWDTAPHGVGKSAPANTAPTIASGGAARTSKGVARATRASY